MQLLEKVGINVRVSKSGLFCHSTTAPVDVLFVRDDDIPTLVNDGVCDVGIVGGNVLKEFELGLSDQVSQIEVAESLAFGKCRLSLAVPADKPFSSLQTFNNTKIATSYPNILKNFSLEHQLNLTILSISGSVEIAPSLGMADAICDLVSTGRTLEENNLAESYTVMEPQALFVRNKHKFNQELEAFYALLLQRIDGAKQAKESKYVMFHAPKEALDNIAEILPGHEGQTIIPVTGNKEIMAVHIVTKEAVFWNTLERLKSVGASSILVLPIEKMLG